MRPITKSNVEAVHRWLNIQTKAYKEKELYFKNLEMDIDAISFVNGVHVDDIRKIAFVLNIPVEKFFYALHEDTDYPHEYWILWNGVKVFSVYKEVVK